MKIGCMIWRIGDILDFYGQIEWIKLNGFDEVEFWTLPGAPGAWQGFDIQRALPEDILRLKHTLDGFREVDIHAGFDETGAGLAGLAKGNTDMKRTFELATEIGAKVVTIHPAQKTIEVSEIESLEKLNELGGKYRVRVGIETMGGTETERKMLIISQLNLKHIGITLDTGHIHFENGIAFESYGGLGNLIDKTNAKIVHVHAHDYDGNNDHIAIGKGYIGFPDIIAALCRAKFSGSICLEINPYRESPESILESKKLLHDMIERICGSI
jgi:sugar phosphate isomerase/epimerase